MAMAFTKSLTAAAIAGVIAIGASVAPASADWRHGGGGGWHGGGGGWHGGGYHGGYGGGWHHGYGGYGVPLAVGGILAGAAIASGAYYYGGYGNPCYRAVPTYDQFGNYVGRHWARIC